MLRLFLLYGSASEFYPSAFFNGMDFRLATYTGGPTYELDHLGVLRSPGANRPAVRGMRLATTVAGGVVLGDEKYPPVTTRLSTATVTSLSPDGASFSTNAAGGFYYSNAGLIYGRLYIIQFARTSTVQCDVYNVNDPNPTGKITVGEGEFYFTAVATGIYVRNSLAGITTDIFISIREVTPTYLNTDESGNPIIHSTPQKTVTYNTDWTTKTIAETFYKFDISDPLKAPGWLCEPVRTNYALNSATPATYTTGTLAVGTYTLWQEGTGSIVATSGTAVGTFGTASNGAPATITITTAGTVVLTASGTNTWVQLELGAFKTSRIYTTTAPMIRAATIASFPTAGKIPVNNFAIRMIVVPRASGQIGYLWSCYVDATNDIRIVVEADNSVLFRKKISNVTTDVFVGLSVAKGSPIDLICVHSANLGMQVSARRYSSSWGSFTNGTVNGATAAKANAPITSTYQLGALNSGSQFTGNISLFDCIPIPSGITDQMAWAKTHWGVA